MAGSGINNMDTVPIKILIADNREIFREGLVKLLQDQSHIEVVYQCGSGAEAIEKAKEIEPDIILMDIDMPDQDGIEAVKYINESVPNIKVAMLTDCEDEEKLFSAIKAGARGYLLKDIAVDRLIKSIDLVVEGEVIVSPPMADKLLNEFTSMKDEIDAKKTESENELSDREVEILKLVAGGATNKEIAESLVIAENTVKVHVRNVLEKLHLRNKQQAAAYAMKQGFISEIVEEKNQV